MRPVIFLRTLVFLAYLVVVGASTPVTGAPLIFSDKDDVKDIISHFRSEMASLIAQAGGETRVTLVRAFQLTDSAINAMAAAYGDAVNLTFHDLNDQQRKAFSDTSHLLDQIGQSINDPTTRVLEDVETFNSIISDVSSWTKRPIVMRYSPGFISPALLSKDIRIVASGVRLHGAGVAPPKLSLGGKDFAPDEYTDVSIGFTVPRSMFASNDEETSLQSAALSLYHDGGGWNPWRKPEEIQFRLLFTVLPEKLGTYSIKAVIPVSRPDVKHFMSSPDLSASKEGGGGAVDSDCYSPEQGYTFDLTTARLTQTRHLAHKDDDQSPGTNDGGMSYKDGTKTAGLICVQAFAHTGCTECGATTSGHLDVDMVRTVTDDTKSESGDKPLNWKLDVPLDLNLSARSQVLTITLFDSITVVASATVPQTLQFLKIDPDIQNSIVVLRPRRDWNAR